MLFTKEKIKSSYNNLLAENVHRSGMWSNFLSTVFLPPSINTNTRRFSAKDCTPQRKQLRTETGELVVWDTVDLW